jgi:uroporphyrinogen decarboxylase
MRQAGRYMPEYQAIRRGRTFLEMCQTPEIAAEVTELPIRLLDVDAAILFADILLVADALGCGLTFVESRGPVMERPVRTADDVRKLPRPAAGEALGYVAEAVRLLRRSLQVPLIGFAGAPFTVASYMIEGGSSDDLKRTRQWMRGDPESFAALLDRVTELTIDYLAMQIDAGAQAVQVFDSWACYLDHAHFMRYSREYMSRIVRALEPKGVPVILFCRGSSVWARELAGCGPAAISLDWNCSLADVRRQVGSGIALQGNIDPFVLYAPRQVIRDEVGRLLSSMKGDPAFVVNLGHGISPDMSVDAVRTLVERVKEG